MKLLITALAALLLAGCNTMEGLGKDISALGDKLEESSKKK